MFTRLSGLDHLGQYQVVYLQTYKALKTNGRGERIRTSDPLVPNQVRYQTALRPEIVW